MRKLSTLVILGSILFAVGWLVLSPDRPLDGLLVASISMFAGVLVLGRTEDLMTLLIPILMFNREARRLLDWYFQDYSQVPITSLLANIVMLIMGMTAIYSWRNLPVWVRTAAIFYFIALAYGLLIGLPVYKVGAVYTAITWLSPFMVLLFVVKTRPDEAQMRTWFALWVACTFAAVCYGWFQWSVLPPWDKFWMVNADMSSMGLPIPMRCRFFGPASGPGSLAITTMFAILFLIFGFKRFRIVSIPLVIFFAVSMLMTQSRSVFITMCIAAIMTPFFMRGANTTKSFLVVFTLIGMVAFVLPRLPGGEGATRRLQTLMNVHEDGSFQGRAEFSARASFSILARPQGFGLGSAGLGSRVDSSVAIAAFDNGYLAVLFTLGLPGAALIFLSFKEIVVHTVLEKRLRGEARLIALCKGVFVAYLFQMLPSNWLDNENAFVFWSLVGYLAVLPAQVSQMVRRPELIVSNFYPTISHESNTLRNQ